MIGQQLELATLKRAWIDNAAVLVLFKSHVGDQFTTDDLRSKIPPPPEPNWIGCLAARLRNSGFMREAGRVKSTRPERNGAKIPLWEVL